MNKYFDKLNMSKKGFTIIELIVVIAIIAVLAGIVLVNVTQYINKGKVSAIQGNTATLLTNSILYFTEDDNPSGNDFATADTKYGCAGAVSSAITDVGERLFV